MFYSQFGVLYSPSDFTEPAEESEGGVRSRVLGFTIVSSRGQTSFSLLKALKPTKESSS